MTVHQQPWFAWREGFCIHGIGRVVEVRDGIVWTLDDATGVRRTLVADALACFTGLRFIWDDDALGALIRLLQERTGDPEAHVRLQSSDRGPAWWSCHVSEAAPGGWMRRGQHASAVDALLFGLESCYLLEQGSDAIAAQAAENLASLPLVHFRHPRHEWACPDAGEADRHSSEILAVTCARCGDAINRLLANPNPGETR